MNPSKLLVQEYLLAHSLATLATEHGVYASFVDGDRKASFNYDQIESKAGEPHGLKNVRFSGGEPTVYKGLVELVAYCKARGVERIAISTNGSAPQSLYDKLLAAGANDFSVSLDACCAEDADKMAGVKGKFDRIVESIRYLSSKTYVTVGVVLNQDNLAQLKDTVLFAHNLGVADIRIISAAQFNETLEGVLGIPEEILDAHPILKYRVNNLKAGRNVRGLQAGDANRCHLAWDDCVVAGPFHFPCVIYMREQGEPIGRVSPQMREERINWLKGHDIHADPICSRNCLDVCIDFLNKFRELMAPDYEETPASEAPTKRIRLPVIGV